MTEVAPRESVDLFMALPALRATIHRIWEKFLATAGIDQLTPEDGWLLVQLTAGPLSLPEMDSILSLFVDEPRALIERNLERGWLRAAEDGSSRYELTETARQQLYRILPVAQSSNEGWRSELAHNDEERRQLEMVLAILQGARHT